MSFGAIGVTVMKAGVLSLLLRSICHFYALSGWQPVAVVRLSCAGCCRRIAHVANHYQWTSCGSATCATRRLCESLPASNGLHSTAAASDRVMRAYLVHPSNAVSAQLATFCCTYHSYVHSGRPSICLRYGRHVAATATATPMQLLFKLHSYCWSFYCSHSRRCCCRRTAHAYVLKLLCVINIVWPVRIGRQSVWRNS